MSSLRDPASEDIVSVVLPENFSFRMLYGHRDLVARRVEDGGWQSFETPMPDLFFRQANEAAGLVIDVGINTGFYSFIACGAHRDNLVLGFEPDPQVFACAQQNIALNGLESRISLSPLALSDRVGAGNLHIPRQDHGLIESSSSLEAEFNPPHSAVIAVSVSTLDAVLNTTAPQQRVSIIKIDVEGHELSVLRGANATICKYRPVIFVEILDRADYTALSALVVQHDYCDVPLRQDGLVERKAVAFDAAAWNHALVPRERLSAFLAG